MKRLKPGFSKGLIHRRCVQKFLPEWMRFDLELGPELVKKSIELIEKRTYTEGVEQFTANKFFEYCRIAYLANLDTFSNEIDKDSSGKDLYARFADGRDGGLKEIDPDSPQAFDVWYEHGARGGGHPWEIYRGGNTTHIDLSVNKEMGKYKVYLSAYASTRLAETCRIALAFEEAGLPFSINHQRSYLLRLRGEDWVGVIPDYDYVHRGWQRFPKDFDVADCIQFSWLRDDMTRKWPLPPRTLSRLISWLPERPVLLL